VAKGSVIARRWAQALFEAARDAGAVAEVGRDLQAVVDALWGDEAVRRFFLSDRTPVEAKKRLITSGPGPHRLVRNFVLLCLDKRREAYLPDMAFTYRTLVDRSEGVVEAEVRTAVQLPQADRDRLEAALSAKLRRRVRTKFIVEPSLIGGLAVRIDDRLFDASLKRRLERLRERLAGAGAGVLEERVGVSRSGAET